jgi:Spy/CpxP family protein refolding chaperone
MRTRIIGLCSIALTCGLMLAQAQGSPPTPLSPAQMAAHEVSFLTQLLSLTSDQQKQVTAILTTAASSGASFHSSMAAAHTALQTAIQTNDPAAIGTASAKIGELTAQQVQAKATADAAIYALLTPDQQTKFKAISSHGPGGFGGHGGPMGGPGMPPPPGA